LSLPYKGAAWIEIKRITLLLMEDMIMATYNNIREFMDKNGLENATGGRLKKE